MALISELRKRSWIILTFIALALVLFLATQALNSNTSVFNRHKAPDFAKIEGRAVDRSAFDERRQEEQLEYLTFNDKLLDYMQQQYTIDEETSFRIDEQAWQDFVNEKLINEQMDKLGLTMTDAEYTNIIYGPDPHPIIKNYYIGLSQTGQYDASKLPDFVNQVSDPDVQQKNPQALKEYYMFLCREAVAKRSYLQQKYTSLFTESVYVPEWMKKHQYETSNRRATFAYCTLPYTQVADSTVHISESEMKSYYEENQNKYKQDEDSRVVEYVFWYFTPTSGDSAAILQSLKDMAGKMSSISNDSAYVASRSEDPDRFGGSVFTRSDLEDKGVPPEYIDSIFIQPTGTLAGPFRNEGYYKYALIDDRQTLPDSVDARHILIGVSANRDSTRALAIADSLLDLLHKGADFAELAGANSDDPGSRDKGGELDWQTPKVNFVPEFKDYLFKTGKKGEYGIVKTQFGYHIIQIEDIKQSEPFVTLAFLSRQIIASKETIDSLDRIASTFYEKYNTPESFEKGVTEEGIRKTVSAPLSKSQYAISDIPDSRTIITWAFESKKGEFKYFSLNDRILIAFVKEVKNAGISPLGNVSDQVRQEVLREKKGDMLTKRIADAASGNNSLNAIAGKLQAHVDTSRNASLGSAMAQGLGLEPKVVGTVFGTAAGSLTPPVAGNRGAYVMQVLSFTEPKETTDYTLNGKQLQSSLKQKMSPEGILNVLKDKANIVDNRYMFNE